MRVLMVWGSKLGGTAGIAQVLGESLRDAGIEVVLGPAREHERVTGFDAVIVGGALYAGRWHRDARRFMNRHVDELRRVPVWVFSSGPLDDTANEDAIPPVTQVAALMERVGARGHRTFGGRLAHDAKGFAAHAMAKTMSGDWRNPERIRAWASELAAELPSARPGVAIDPPARSASRLIEHGLVIAVASAAATVALPRIVSGASAWVLQTVVTIAIVTLVARHYFLARGAREPMQATTVFAVMLAAGLAIAGVGTERSAAFVTSITWFWMPLVLGAVASALTGVVCSMLPLSRRTDVARREPLQHA